jgi:hypothetical protein
MLAPLTQLDDAAITSAYDIPEPMFPDNHSSESNRCMLEEQLRCVEGCMRPVHFVMCHVCSPNCHQRQVPCKYHGCVVRATMLVRLSDLEAAT